MKNVFIQSQSANWMYICFADKLKQNKMHHVQVYNTSPFCVTFLLYSTGQVTIPGDITFQLDTDPATDPSVFTLTCTSTGGPATTVSWRRDGTVLSDSSTYSITSQVLTDAVTATYTHTLTVTGRLVGEYQCSVSNIRTPSGSSRSLTVVGKECNVSQRKHT